VPTTRTLKHDFTFSLQILLAGFASLDPVFIA
jgi:hypothetical protein